MKIKKILEKSKCGFKSYLDSMEFSTAKNLNYEIAVSLRKVLTTKERVFLTDESEIYNHLLANIDTNIYADRFEYDERLKSLSKLIRRYSLFELQNYNVIDISPMCIVKVGEEDVLVNADIVLEPKKEKDRRIILSFDKSKPSLSYRARKKENSPYNDLSLYFYSKMGEQLYKGFKISSGIIHLKSKGDKTDNLDENFDSKKGHNLITIDSSESKVSDEEILNIIRSKDISKCNTSKCTTCVYNNICTYKARDLELEKLNANTKNQGKVVFNPTISQLKFIKWDSGNVRVNAVAGSGKTTVIAKRVLNLIKNGYSPKDILLITFSEKGCEELFNKLNLWKKQDNVKFNIKDIDIKTFNGFCYDLVKENYKELGFKRKPVLIEKIMKYGLIADVIKDKPKIKGMNYEKPYQNFFNAKGVCIELSELFDRIKKEEVTYAEELNLIFDFDIDVSRQIMSYYNEYIKLLKKNSLLDFQDQINLGISLILGHKAKEYSHIMVDEFQDSDKQQLFIIRKLIETNNFKSLAVLGDENQSIYSFRDTSPKNIIEFDKDFSDVNDINLKTNYRSTQSISDLANKINRINGSDKELKSKKYGIKPQVYSGNEDKVVEIVENLINNGADLKDIAIISRTKKELLAVSGILDSKKIPSLLRVGEVLIDNPKIKNIIGYSQFIKDNSLLMHFLEYLQVVDYEGYSKAKDLRVYINEKYLEFIGEYKINELTDKEKIKVFFESLKEVSKKDKAVEKLISVLKDYKFKSIDDLAKYLKNMKDMGSDLSVNKDEEEYKAIDLITAHSSKGREYKYVIAMLDNFKIPTLTSKQNNSEELRLFYVTITRAKDELIMVSNTHLAYEIGTLIA